jgi:intracellular multiplication protein IcmJ
MAAKGVLPLVLSVKAANWRMNDDNSEAADAEFEHERRRALERDDRTCRFCGFRAPKYQEVHHLNDDHADNRLENLVTACGFCHSVQHIGLSGKMKESVLAWLPEISQDRLHHIVRSLLVVSRWADTIQQDRRQQQSVVKTAVEMQQAAKGLETKLRSRTAEAERRFLTSDPLELGTILQQIGMEQPTLYDKRKDFLNGLRLLPLGRRMQGARDTMPDIIDSWLGTGGPYANLSPRTWLSVLKQVGG